MFRTSADTSARFTSAPGVRAGSLASVAQMTHVSHHEHGSNTVLGSRTSVNLREWSPAPRHSHPPHPRGFSRAYGVGNRSVPYLGPHGNMPVQQGRRWACSLFLVSCSFIGTPIQEYRLSGKNKCVPLLDYLGSPCKGLGPRGHNARVDCHDCNEKPPRKQVREAFRIGHRAFAPFLRN